VLRYVIDLKSDPFEEFLLWVWERIFRPKRVGAAVSIKTSKSTKDMDRNGRRCDSLTSRKDSVLHCVPYCLLYNVLHQASHIAWLCALLIPDAIKQDRKGQTM